MQLYTLAVTINFWNFCTWFHTRCGGGDDDDGGGGDDGKCVELAISS